MWWAAALNMAAEGRPGIRVSPELWGFRTPYQCACVRSIAILGRLQAEIGVGGSEVLAHAGWEHPVFIVNNLRPQAMVPDIILGLMTVIMVILVIRVTCVITSTSMCGCKSALPMSHFVAGISIIISGCQNHVQYPSYESPCHADVRSRTIGITVPVRAMCVMWVLSITSIRMSRYHRCMIIGSVPASGILSHLHI